jgi:CheY-like chemotaxis protein
VCKIPRSVTESPLRILICEDDDGLAALVTETLDTDGRFVVIGRATSGREAVELASEWRAARGVRERGEPSAQKAVVGVGEEDRDAPAEWRWPVAVGAGNADDEAVEAKTTQVVGHAPGGQALDRNAEQRGEMAPQGAVVETVRLEPGNGDGRQQGVDAGIAEAQRRCPLTVDDGGTDHSAEHLLADDGVVGEGLDAKEPAVGGEADQAQGVQVTQPLADAEVN